MLIGRGPWGRTIARTLGEMGIDFVHAARDFANHLSSIPGQSPFDGAIIATPASTHAEIALKLLELKLPLFIEKPLALSVMDAERIIDAAKGLLLMVDHTDLFGGEYARFAESFHKSPRPRHLELRYCGSISHPDVSPLWDYGSHAVAFAVSLLGEPIDFDSKVSDGQCEADIDLWFKWGDTASIQVRYGRDDAHGSRERPKMRWGRRLGSVYAFDGYASPLAGEEPPLTRALRAFVERISLCSTGTVTVDQEMAVIRVLEKCGSSTWEPRGW